MREEERERARGDAAGQEGGEGAMEVVNLHVGPSVRGYRVGACGVRAASIMEIASVGMTFGE